jgi:hypothetical protein
MSIGCVVVQSTLRLTVSVRSCTKFEMANHHDLLAGA